MIDRPHIDHELLEAATDEVIAMVDERDPMLITIAEQFGDDVAAWLRSLRRDDQGLPSVQVGADQIASGTVEANALAPHVISDIDALIEVIRQGATAGADEAARAAARDACRTVAIALDAAPREPNPALRPAARAQCIVSRSGDHRNRSDRERTTPHDQPHARARMHACRRTCRVPRRQPQDRLRLRGARGDPVPSTRPAHRVFARGDPGVARAPVVPRRYVTGAMTPTDPLRLLGLSWNEGRFPCVTVSAWEASFRKEHLPCR